jgi:mannosylglycerate hydrolase
LITYHVIPHTHWDREWYLSFDHFRAALVHMMDDLLDILEQRPDYAHFLLDGQTVVAEDYLEVRPERRAVIERLVREERLSMGPWYVLPDTFLVSGESLVRNILLGRRMARDYGQSMDVGYIPDSFGHTAQIPQILRGFGLETAIVWRGFGGELGQEGSEYRWQAPDGSEVLMEHLGSYGYSGAYFDGDDPAAWEERFEDFRRELDQRATTDARLVLSGGDHHWPTRSLPDVIEHLKTRLGGRARVEHSSLSRFVRHLSDAAERDSLPLEQGEFRFGYRWAFNVTGGVYSARMYLKQANARAQRLLERYLEPLNVMAVSAGGRSQKPLLDLGWKYLLQNHPHDSICGCSIDSVHREMMARFEKLDNLAEGIERFAWLDLAPAGEGTHGDDRWLAVFNPSAFERDEVIECEVAFFRQQVVVGLNPDIKPDDPLAPVDGFALIDESGRDVQFEVIERDNDFGIALNRYNYPAQSRVEQFRICLLAESLPPLGIKALRIERRDGFTGAPDHGLEAGDDFIENRYLRVETRVDGSFIVTDRETGHEYGPLGFMEDGADAGDEYNYSPPPMDEVRELRGDASVIQITTEKAATRVRLKVAGEWSLPAGLKPDLSARSFAEVRVPFTVFAVLTPLSRHVTFVTHVGNTASDHRLRAVFETGIDTNVHHAETAFAVVSREQKAYDPAEFAIEVPAAVAPMQRFVTIEDEQRGATILGDGLPEYELVHDSKGRIALTLLRCVGELGREDLAMRPGGMGGWKNSTPDAQCHGHHTFRYAFLPHRPGWPDRLEMINRAADSLLMPPAVRALREAPSVTGARLAVEPASLVLSAVKRAEDEDGVIVRVCNIGPETIVGSVRPGWNVNDVLLANLEESGSEAAPLEEGGIRASWAPFEIKTFRVR